MELFAQTQQLIAGGRDPVLRGRRTRDMLGVLTERNWIEPRVREELDSAYCRFRRVEHRLQMIRDEQTHELPDDAEGLARIARLSGFDDPDAFAESLTADLERVSRRYSQLFEHEETLSADVGNLVFTGDDDDPGTLETLSGMGFDDPAGVTRAVRAWHFGRYPATRSARAREHLTELTPRLLKALAERGDADAALRAFDALLKGLPAGVQLFALLSSNPHLLDLLAQVLGTAPRLAETFARRPQVTNTLIDPAMLAESVDRPMLRDLLRTSLSQADGYEDVLDRVRLFAAEHRFLVSVRLISGVLAPVDAGRAFSDLAECAVEALLEAVQDELRRVHGEPPGSRVAILAFGRLGSREMTAASDLDLIVIYDHDNDATQSDGARPLAPSQYFIRLTQRLVAALSAPTAEGIAYPVDLRLRPSGKAGPLATRVDAFARYQATEAWTWEHMALTRARPIAGDPELQDRVADIVRETVRAAAGKPDLANDIREMRQKVDEARADAGTWTLKTVAGGLMDLEFLAQYLILAGLPVVAGETLEDILARATSQGRLEADDGGRLMESAALQAAAFQAMRVIDPEPFDPAERPPGVGDLIARTAITAAVAATGALPEPVRSLMNSSEQGNAPLPISLDVLDGRLKTIQVGTRDAMMRILGKS